MIFLICSIKLKFHTFSEIMNIDLKLYVDCYAEKLEILV